MKTIANNWQYLLGGLYTWIVSIFFGAILLDIVYSNTVRSTLKPSETAALFSEGADFLLLIGTLTIIAAIGAICSSWSLGFVRNLFIASILFVVLEFLTPMLFFSLIQMAQINLGLNVGSWVRLSGSALSSILAFVGLWKLYTST